MSTQWVVVSPHFDDAALSVGALIAARTAAGDSVEVLTVYTDGPPVAQLSGRTKIFGDYPTRRAEDDRALRLLGATAARLGLRERLFRNPLPRRPIQVFRTPRRAAQFERCTAVQEAVAARLRDPETRVLAPLGVGNHYDHVEVAVAAIRAGVACDATDRIRFYEDFNALSELCRRRHPVARTAPHPWWAAPAWAGLASGAAIEAMALAVRGPSSATLAGQDPAGGARWTAHRVPVGTY
ncbi:MAG: hypothetical protein HOQ24_13515, partial [Mycobacteriaceae bacterium]|nr:hypothetical protein [Mycobacteriaceae bacterium]